MLVLSTTFIACCRVIIFQAVIIVYEKLIFKEPGDLVKYLVSNYCDNIFLFDVPFCYNQLTNMQNILMVMVIDHNYNLEKCYD